MAMVGGSHAKISLPPGLQVKSRQLLAVVFLGLRVSGSSTARLTPRTDAASESSLVQPTFTAAECAPVSSLEELITRRRWRFPRLTPPRRRWPPCRISRMDATPHP